MADSTEEALSPAADLSAISRRIRSMGLLLTVIVVTWGYAIHHVRSDPPLPPRAFDTSDDKGFDLGNLTIPRDEVFNGGPPRDGIPAILKPKFVTADQVDYLGLANPVIAVSIGDEHKAYPLQILVQHEIVNDTVGGVPIAATYCPLCGTAMVFDRRVGDSIRTFGVSGLLYQSDVLMYDHQSESLWSQLMMAAVSGPAVDQPLTWIPSTQMTWGAWKEAHPNGRVLSTDTGFRRDYKRMPYMNYFESESTLFPVPKHRDELAEKAWVAGILVDGTAKAYPMSNFLESESVSIPDTVGDTDLRVHYDKKADAITVTRASGEEIPVVRAYWFAWQAFYPKTLLFEG